jgi:hypothetical protein
MGTVGMTLVCGRWAVAKTGETEPSKQGRDLVDAQRARCCRALQQDARGDR